MTVHDANKALQAVLAAARKNDEDAFLAGLKTLQAASRGGNLPTPHPVVTAFLRELDDERFANRRPKS